MKEIRIYTKDEELKDMFKEIKSYRIRMIVGDGRKKSVYNRGANNCIKRLKDYGFSLEIGSNENIKTLKIRRDKILLKLMV